MEFCPTCGNMLLFELPKMEFSSRLCCPTCPYVIQIENKVKIKRNQRLVRKPIDFIFTDDDRKNLNKTSDGFHALIVIMGKLLSHKCRPGQPMNQ
ncbi:hypothetical protein CASFOL_023777 [Castilleja foliolosa]|uniref:DNA-directed RNA polymerase II subunit RPB9-like zinc ribbon domain-containing protein n=1 Tax=Castilleja foliolosa TaxID=1961234 RepID=A0ABD3CLH4_9LAMI